jgi:hypothetical protein
MRFWVFLRVFTHIILPVSPNKWRKVHALISSGCVRRRVSKQSWQSQFLDRFLEKWPADGLPVEGVDGEGDLLTIDGTGLDVPMRLRQFGNRAGQGACGLPALHGRGAKGWSAQFVIRDNPEPFDFGGQFCAHKPTSGE